MINLIAMVPHQYNFLLPLFHWESTQCGNYLHEILFGNNDDAHIQPEMHEQLIQATQAGQVRQAVFIIDLDIVILETTKTS